MSSRLQDLDASRPLQSTLGSCANPHFDHHITKPTGSAREGGGQKDGNSLAMEELLRPSITIKPHPPRITVKPRILQPLMLVPREHIRLSFLDLSSPFGSFESSQSFNSNIRILDLESRMGNRPVVLIARLESNKSNYVIERQENSLYTLCHLGSWVDLEQLCDVASVSLAGLIRKQQPLPAPRTTAAPLTTPQISHTYKKRRLAIEAIQSLVKKPTRSRSVSALSQADDAARPPTATRESERPNGPKAESVGVVDDLPFPDISAPVLNELSQGPVADVEGEALTAPNAGIIFNNIRNQYSEALYHSMGSLAYFAKGPLSRARAAFHLDCDATLDMNDLIGFLKSLVMNTVLIDKKYRETIPKIQAEMKTTFDDSDAEQGQGKGKARKRKAKKIKVGKDGLYPDEDEHVRKWWTSHMPRAIDHEESTTKSTQEQETRMQISRLRSRETQLQMIIILEILALEPLVSRESNTREPQLPGLPPTSDAKEAPKEPATKKRNRHNLPFLLEVHADRLCIWHSTALDEFNVASESQSEARHGSRKHAASTTLDPLKDFCVDIIVPFFSARLPAQCDSINRKLGGPVLMSPPKPVAKKTTDSGTKAKSQSKPGAATKRPAPVRSNQSLESFLSKETERNRRSMSRGPSGVIALMRSATTPTVPLLKREPSEPLSLSGIPKAEGSAAAQRKNTSNAATMPALKRKWAEAKEERDAFVKAELKDAISALRRPNREVVGKSIAEERRAITSLSQLRKSRKPTHYPQSQNVVKATPVGNRFHDVLAKGSTSQPNFLRRPSTGVEDTIPPSSMVPSSAPRKRNRDAAFGEEPTTRPKPSTSTTDQVQSTPAKPSGRSDNFLSVPQFDEGVVLASSPIMSRRISQPNFTTTMKGPATFGHRDSGIDITSSPGNVNVTPIKPRMAAANLPSPMDRYVTTTPMRKPQALPRDDLLALPGSVPKTRPAVDSNEVKRKPSLFERLGWDDYGDDLA
ncbi:DNA replication regulator SLD3-domain-containing protein [Poronia punctata]|nr:DNA replication regulator SLD3-domain-containing protein [Poronia punctata]